MKLACPSGVRRGFTLIETLVVIAMISVLIGMLVPAVQKVRELARQTECGNNIKQIALASFNYESQKGRLPPGYIGPKNNKSIDAAVAYGDAEDNQWVGHLPLLLPFLEQEPLIHQIQVKLDPDVQSPPWWEPKPTPGFLPPDYQVATQTFQFFLCPANPNLAIPFQPGSTTGTVVGLHDYNTGPFLKSHHYVENYDDGSGNPWTWTLGLTNYVGVSGAGKGTSSWWRKWEGVYTNRSKNRSGDITDGRSNTLLYGETAGQADPANGTMAAANALNLSWFGVGAMAVTYGLAHGEKANWNQFSSYHTRGVHFAFADGSVRRLPFEIDPQVLKELAGMKDGSVAPIFE